MISPVTELDARYGEAGVTSIEWAQVRDQLVTASIYWLSTVRPQGQPHVTPLIAVWMDDALFLCTGPEERKAKNLEQNRHVALTTGTNELHAGFDVVVEGDAVRLIDAARLQRVADLYEVKYGSAWHFDVRDGGFAYPNGLALVFEVAPSTVFAFGKDPYSQTKFKFDRRLEPRSPAR